MTDILDTGRRIPVYYELGVFEGEASRKRLAKAPFDLLELQPNPDTAHQLFILPNQKAVGTCAVYDLANLGAADYPQAIGQDFGFFDGRSVVVGEHEMGGHEAHPNDWKGCFRLGYI